MIVTWHNKSKRILRFVSEPGYQISIVLPNSMLCGIVCQSYFPQEDLYGVLGGLMARRVCCSLHNLFTYIQLL